MAKRVAPQGIAAQQDHIHKQHERPDSHAEMAVKPESIPRIAGKNDQERQCKIEKISMNILQD